MLFAQCRSERGDPAPRTVVLISIDTLRADHLGSYGYSRPTSPHMDALAAQAVLFEDVTSPSPWTLPAHASLLTGLYPSRHGLTTHTSHLPESVTTLAEMLARQGFMTAAVVNSHRLSSHYGLERGFEKFLYVKERAGQREPGTAITDKATQWLRRFAGERLFLFVHYYDVHSDYASRPEFERPFVRVYHGPADGTTNQLRAHRAGTFRFAPEDARHLVDLYDAGIRQMDEELARLLSAIETHGAGRALVIVTSDHGEEFLERGGVLHGRTQFQELLRVPLILRGPGLPRGHRVKTPVSLVDVLPTLLRLVTVDASAGLDGEDLTSLWSGAPRLHLGRRALFAEADHWDDAFDITSAVRRERHKLHFNRLTGASQLFDLEQDPGEQVDLSVTRPDVREDLGARLARLRELRRTAAARSSAPLSPEEVERLRSLGYMQ